MINDIFDEINECCNKRSNCIGCPLWSDEHGRCLFGGNFSFWDMDTIRDAIQKMREDNVNRLKEEKEKKMTEYKVVRSYDGGKYEEKLQEAFNEGFEFVRASEFIPESRHSGTIRYGYIEYILKKENLKRENK